MFVVHTKPESFDQNLGSPIVGKGVTPRLFDSIRKDWLNCFAMFSSFFLVPLFLPNPFGQSDFCQPFEMF